MNEEPELPLRERLTREIGECFSTDLSAHILRGAVVIVDASLDILDVGYSIATDEVTEVQNWIETKRLVRPSRDQVEKWEAAQDARFRTLIVRPYVLVQPLFDA